MGHWLCIAPCMSSTCVLPFCSASHNHATKAMHTILHPSLRITA